MSLIGQLQGSRFGNATLVVDQDNRADKLLLDCGYLRDLGDRELTRIRTLFVSHTHLDHFIDFDFWIAAWIRAGRSTPELGELTCFGPPGFIRNVAGHLSGYLWNLIEFQLRIVCHEIDQNQCQTVSFNSLTSFSPSESVMSDLSGATEISSTAGKIDFAKTPIYRLWSDDRLVVVCADLDHGTPCLGFAVIEKPVQVIDKTALARMSLQPGGWIKQMKDALSEGAAPTTSIETPAGPQSLEYLSQKLLREKNGQKICYITDTIYNKKTAPLIEILARSADTLFIESAFLHADLDKARETCHLTARQAGRLGRAANVRKLVQFHFSGKYQNREKELLAETEAALND